MFQVRRSQSREAASVGQVSTGARLARRETEHAPERACVGLGIGELVVVGDVDDSLVAEKQVDGRFRQTPAHKVIVGRVLHDLVERARKVKEWVAHGIGNLTHGYWLPQAGFDEAYGVVDRRHLVHRDIRYCEKANEREQNLRIARKWSGDCASLQSGRPTRCCTTFPVERLLS